MIWHPNPYAFALLACAVSTGWVALYAWRRRSVAGAAAAFVMLGAAIWAGGYGVATGVYDLAGRILWAKIQYIGIAMVGVAAIPFVLRYTGQARWLTRRNIILVAVVPLVGVALVWTNEVHHLIWVNLRLVIANSVALLNIEYGPYFWFYALYNNLVTVVCFILLLRAFRGASHLQRSQVTGMLVGLSLAIGANWLYLLKVNPFPDLDLTPFGYSLGGLVMIWGVFRYRLFDIVPVARAKVLEEMRDGIIVLDVQARVVDANPAALRLMGRAADQVIGQPVKPIFFDRLGLFARFPEVIEPHTQIVIGEGKAQRNYDLDISPLQDRRGKLTGRVIALHDVTERVQAEEVQRQAEEALRQYTVELETRNQELDDFAHTVAHDIRNPVGQIISYAEVLEQYDDLSEDERAHSLRVLVKTGGKIINILDELLLLAGLRRADVQTEPLNMAAIVAGARERLADEIERAQAEVVTPAEWPVALGHVGWVEEIWVNYISNACKYGGPAPCVTLGADRVLPVMSSGDPAGTLEKRMIRFWVRDSGVGISLQNQTRLFTPFTRLDQARAKGHGLGLSIVRRIVEKLGGEVGVESQGLPGQGSTFSFTLPAAPEGTLLPAPPEVLPVQDWPTLAGVGLLIVDDEEFFADGFRRLLTARGLRVLGVARNGLEAQAQARQLNPQVIVMDIDMPLVNGLHATRLIKAEQPDIKIVILSASERDEHLFEAIRSGASGYLLKGIRSEAFCAQLAGLLRGEAPLAPGLAARILAEFARLPDTSMVVSDQALPPHQPDAPDSAAEELTACQQDILARVARGQTYKEIGAALDLTERTVKYHLGEIVEKLHVKNR